MQDLRTVISNRVRFVLALVFSLAIFSTSQEENWCNGFMLNAALSAGCVLAGIVCLSRFGATYTALCLCVLLGTVASYSFGNGVTYWAAAVPLLYVKLRDDPRRVVKSLLWVASAGAVTALYFYRLGSNGNSESFGGLALGILHVPGTFFTYFFTCAGAGVFFLNGTKAGLSGTVQTLIACGAPVCGFVGLNAFMVTVWRLLRRQGQDLSLIAPWLSLGLYAMFTVAVISIVRYHFALESAIASRYILFSQFLWLSLFACLAILSPKMKPGWRRGAGTVLILCYGISYANGLRHERMTCVSLRQIRQELLTHPTKETYLSINGDRDPAQVADFMEMTRRHRLALFRDEPVH